MKELKIPQLFLVAPFFMNDDEILFDKNIDFNHGLNINPLLFDVYDMMQINALKPWEDKEKYIPMLLSKWRETEPMITKLFEVRDRQSAFIPMKSMIATFVAFLFWVNERPVPGLKNLSAYIVELKIKPVNAIERIEYLLAVPNQYHAFIQLQQLFIELNKKYAVAKLK